MFLLQRKTMSGTENMAFDSMFFDMEHFSKEARIRFYDWSSECHTFGISQAAADFVGVLPSGTPMIKRPTGGGHVRHLHTDITYALVVPSSHDFFMLRPRDSYVEIHSRIGAAIGEAGIVSEILKTADQAIEGSPAQCFVASSYGDLVSGENGKFAGAAQKRTRSGVLLQGSVKIPDKID
jgi:lipoate-protein ligase A